MTPTSAGALATVNIVFCVIVGFLMFGAAALGSIGGFNPLVLLLYGGLALSMLTSFYLLANRRELSAAGRTRFAALAAVWTLTALSPIILEILRRSFG